MKMEGANPVATASVKVSPPLEGTWGPKNVIAMVDGRPTMAQVKGAGASGEATAKVRPGEEIKQIYGRVDSSRVYVG
jgi:hypothetical protein